MDELTTLMESFTLSEQSISVYLVEENIVGEIEELTALMKSLCLSPSTPISSASSLVGSTVPNHHHLKPDLGEATTTFHALCIFFYDSRRSLENFSSFQTPLSSNSSSFLSSFPHHLNTKETNSSSYRFPHKNPSLSFHSFSPQILFFINHFDPKPGKDATELSCRRYPSEMTVQGISREEHRIIPSHLQLVAYLLGLEPLDNCFSSRASWEKVTCVWQSRPTTHVGLLSLSAGCMCEYRTSSGPLQQGSFLGWGYGLVDFKLKSNQHVLCIAWESNDMYPGQKGHDRHPAASPEEGEARAIFRGLELAVQLGVSDLVALTDSRNIASFLQRGEPALSWKATTIAQDIKQISSNFVSCNFVNISRQFNYISDVLAKVGRLHPPTVCTDPTLLGSFLSFCQSRCQS